MLDWKLMVLEVISKGTKEVTPFAASDVCSCMQFTSLTTVQLQLSFAGCKLSHYLISIRHLCNHQITSPVTWSYIRYCRMFTREVWNGKYRLCHFSGMDICYTNFTFGLKPSDRSSLIFAHFVGFIVDALWAMFGNDCLTDVGLQLSGCFISNHAEWPCIVPLRLRHFRCSDFA